MMTVPSQSKPILFAAATLLIATNAGHAVAQEREPVVSTTQFAFYSDLATNLNDALITAGSDRNAGEPELFTGGPEKACFDALPSADRAEWDRAVDYYGEVISPTDTFDRERFQLRLYLMGATTDENDRPEDAGIVEDARPFLTGAEPAYRSCRWPAQDGENRRWIDELMTLLDRHEETIARQHTTLYETSWDGLPLIVDVVETAGWSGASSIYLDPAGGHILISSSNQGNQGLAALEMVFHEAAHLLTGSESPLRRALDEAIQESGIRFRGDLTHMVHFYMTGAIVRRVLQAAGEPDYRPYIYAQQLFMEGGRLRPTLESSWPAYMDGERTLSEAVADLMEALTSPRDSPR